MASCTCPVIIVGHHGPSEARNLAHDCPEHGDAARRAAIEATDPVDAVRSMASASARFRVLCDLLTAESDRGAPRKSRIREIAQAAALCAHQARRAEIASEGGRRG